MQTYCSSELTARLFLVKSFPSNTAAVANKTSSKATKTSIVCIIIRVTNLYHGVKKPVPKSVTCGRGWLKSRANYGLLHLTCRRTARHIHL